MTEIPLTGPFVKFDDFTLHLPERGEREFFPCSDLRNPRKDGNTGDEPGIWLIRSKTGSSVIVPDGVPVVRNGRPVIALAVLHHADQLSFSGELGRFSEVRAARLRSGDAMIGRRCQQCHTTFQAGADIVICPLCGEGYCEDCWDYLRDARCYSRGCSMVPVPIESRVAL